MFTFSFHKSLKIMDIKVTIEYKNIVFDQKQLVTRIIKYKVDNKETIVLQNDTLPQNNIFKGSEPLDEFMKKCFRDHFKFFK
jgi:hypothetical protein